MRQNEMKTTSKQEDYVTLRKTRVFEDGYLCLDMSMSEDLDSVKLKRRKRL